MPTAAKLIGALFLAASGVLVSFVTVGVYPGLEKYLIKMAGTAGVMGFVLGWGSLGTKVAKDKMSVISVGVPIGFSVYIWTILIFGIKHMVNGIMVHAYYQPMTAILQIPAAMISYIKVTVDLRIIAAIAICALVSTAMARRAHLRWDIAVTE